MMSEKDTRPLRPIMWMGRLSTMKIRAMASRVCLVVLWGVFELSAFAAEAPRMEKTELKTKLDHPEVVVIDVRSYTDWLLSGDKIKGAVRENYRDFDGWHAKYPREKTIILYCA
jgi:predicted sulfurtransferase